VLTEFGAEATENGPASKKQTYAFQANYLQRVLQAVAHSPVDGAIYWTLREFAVKPFWDGLENATPAPRHRRRLDPQQGPDVLPRHAQAGVARGGARLRRHAAVCRAAAATAVRAGPPPAGSALPGALLLASARWRCSARWPSTRVLRRGARGAAARDGRRAATA